MRGLLMARQKFGSIKYQVKNMLEKINGIGKSKKEERELYGKKSIENGHLVSQKVHSFSHHDRMFRDLKSLGEFAKSQHGIKNMADIKIDVVKDWIASKNIKYETASNYLSELNKVADNMRFTPQEIKEFRAELKSKLPRAEKVSRAYSDRKLDKVKLPTEKEQIVFRIMREYGLRVSEACHIRIKHIKDDNIVKIQGKGGKWIEKQFDKGLVRKIKENAVNGKFEVSKSTFSKHLKEAIEKTGQKYNGTHGLRHTYAQRLLKQGYSKLQVSQMMAHNRPDITDTYIR